MIILVLFLIQTIELKEYVMAKIHVGDQFPDFKIETVYGTESSISECIGDGKTALVFLRYYGCTLCQYEMINYAEHYNEIVDKDGRLYVVLQSTADSIKKQTTTEAFPFDIICDPKEELYKALDISAAEDMEGLGGGDVMSKITEASKLNLSHGDYEGEELQLPATFVIDKNMTVTYAKYGENGGDTPTYNELKTLLE